MREHGQEGVTELTEAMLAGALLGGLLLCRTGQAQAAAGFEQRYLWTWDHRMDWAGKTPGGIVMGGGGSYRKPAGEYLQDYKALIDYISAHTSFNAIIIWGFLRDTHGGVEAAQELCDHANQRGIRIVPGVGTSGYEGYYFEGDHKYNISTWLREHPGLRAITQEGTPHDALCPSEPQNVQWLQDGCRWLFETFHIGGINFEIGDFFVCYCHDCKRARAAIPGDAPDYYKDMAISTAPVAKLAREIAPDAWLSYATYTGFTPEMAETPPSWVDLIPSGIICQWTLTGMGSDEKWPPGIRPPTNLNTGYLHWGNKSTHTVDAFFVRRVQDICRRSAEAGFLGLATYGEDPAGIFSMRVFYDAWSYFLDNPSASLDEYAGSSLAEWFGSPEHGRKALAILVDLENRGVDRTSIPDAIESAEAARAGVPDPGAQATWGEFIGYLEARLKRIEAEDRVIEGEDAVAVAMREGFRVKQDTSAALVLRRQVAEVLELKVRMEFNMEDGVLPVMRMAFNGEVLGPDRAINRPDTIRTPHHEGYQSLRAYDRDMQAWRVKYDTDFEISEVTGLKYDTLDYSPIFRFRIGDLWQEGANRLTIENLERRFRPTDHGVMVVGHIRLE